MPVGSLQRVLMGCPSASLVSCEAFKVGHGLGNSCQSRTPFPLPHDNCGSRRYTLVEVDDIFIEHADTAWRGFANEIIVQSLPAALTITLWLLLEHEQVGKSRFKIRATTDQAEGPVLTVDGGGQRHCPLEQDWSSQL